MQHIKTKETVQEVSSAKNLVDNSVKSGQKEITNNGKIYGRLTINKKINKIYIILFAVITILIISLILTLVLSNSDKQNDDINLVLEKMPTDTTQQKEWSKKITEQLESNQGYNNGNIEEKTAYYNKLFGLYISEQNENTARKIYIGEVKPANIILNMNILYWLKDSFYTIEDKEGINKTIDDIRKSLEESKNNLQNDDEKQNLQKALDELSKEKEALK